MRSTTVGDARLAASLAAAVASNADQIPAGWTFAVGRPPRQVRVRIVLGAPACTWRGLRRSGWRSPNGVLLATIIALVAALIALSGQDAKTIATTIAVAAGAAFSFVLLVTGFFVCWNAWRLTWPGNRHLVWGFADGQWAMVNLRDRSTRSRTWWQRLRHSTTQHDREDGLFAFDFLSTGRGDGARLARLCLAVADEHDLPVELETRGQKLIAYYQNLGFIVQGRVSWVTRHARMIYRPRLARPRP